MMMPRCGSAASALGTRAVPLTSATRRSPTSPGPCAGPGRATGPRELGALQPGAVVPRTDAILLSGGSGYGLGAADGVMAWVRARGRGFPVRPGEVVPIVPTAVLFDLGATGGESRWPGPADASHACDAAGSQIAEGSVGAGAGATVGKAAGIARAVEAGPGTPRPT